MRLRSLVPVTIALALVAPMSAHAAVKKKPPTYCNVLTDDPKDENRPYLNVLSADIATGKNELVAVLRMQSTDFPKDLIVSELDYAHWTFGVTLNGVDYDFVYDQKWFHGAKSHGASVAKQGVEHTFAIEGNNYVWRIKRSALPSLNKKPGQKFTQFHAESWYRDSSDDHAYAPPKNFYPDKGLSCVKAK
jgi:hypothetical protein